MHISERYWTTMLFNDSFQ